jgi:hypothetical protein
MKKSKIIGVFFFLFIGIAMNAQTKEITDSIETKAPGNYKILKNDNKPIEIPFKMHKGKPLMELKINGKKATMMIDNGILWDQIWLFGSPLVDILNLEPVEESTIGGVGDGEPTASYTSSNLTLKFQDIIFYEQPVLVSPPKAGFSRMFPGADGQLCNTFFKHFIVEFDFVRNKIILHKYNQFKYKGKGSIIDMQANSSGTYSIPFRFEMLNGKVYDERVDIDLGGIYPLKIALNNRHNIEVPFDVKETFSYGAQGKASEYIGKIINMKIGKYNFKNPVAIFGDEKTSRIHPDNLGVIGLPLFMKFNIIFDYFNNKIYLEPNKDFSKPFK